MTEKFTIEIISPDNTILKTEASEVIIPSFEGQMGILKDHIPLITFLRPGFINIKNQDEKKYFVEEGTVEFSENNLLILTSTVIDLSNYDKKYIENLLKETEKKLKESNSSDKEKYILSYKKDSLNEINR